MAEEEQSGSDVDDEQQEHDSELPSGHVDLPLPNEWSDDDEIVCHVFEQVPPQIQPRHRAIVPNGEAHPPPVQQNHQSCSNNHQSCSNLHQIRQPMYVNK